MTADEYNRASQKLAALKFLRDATTDASEIASLDAKMEAVAAALRGSVTYPAGVIGDATSDRELEALNHQREMSNAHAFAQVPDTRRNQLERAGQWPTIPDPPWLAELSQAATTRDSTEDHGRAAEQAALESELHSIHERFHAK